MYSNLTSHQIAYMLLTEQVCVKELAAHLSWDQIHDLEDFVLELIAGQVAGGEHMVHWEASEEVH